MESEGLKLVLGGPVGAGKTTTLRTLSDTPPVSTEMPLTDGAMGEKTTTTVALDFATIMLDDGTPLQLFGLPGQEHFEHMRSIVLNGAFGAILLLRADDRELARHATEWMRALRVGDADLPVVVGVTGADRTADFSIDVVRTATAATPPVPVLTVDVRDAGQAEQLVRTLLLLIE